MFASKKKASKVVAKAKPAAEKKDAKPVVMPTFVLQIPAITVVAAEVNGFTVLTPVFDRKMKNALVRASRTLKSNMGGFSRVELDTEAAIALKKEHGAEDSEEEPEDEESEDEE